jgi:peptide/nickel transport system substrate-binding protein
MLASSRRRWPVALATAVGLVVACAPAAEDGDPPGPVLRVVRTGTDISSLDPLVPSFDNMNVLANAFEGLVRHDRLMAIEPALAVRWETPGPDRWRFELRPGVLFHDGSPLTARVAADAFERVLSDPEAPGRHWLSSVERVEVTEPLSLLLHTRRVDPLLLQRLAHFRLALGSGAGTGAYRVRRWVPGRSVELEAFSEYWGGPPAVRSVHFVPMELEERIAAMSKGDLDLVALPGYGNARAQPGSALLRGPAMTRMFLWIAPRPLEGGGNPLADRRVRQALGLALDRGALSEAVLGDPSLAAFQLVPDNVFGHVAGLAPAVADLDAARTRLAEAGWAAGFEVPLLHRATPIATQTAQLVAGMLEPIGIRAHPREVSGEELFETFGGDTGGLFVAFWTYENGDAGSFLEDCIRSRGADSGSSAFNVGFSSPAADALIDEALVELRGTRRLELYEEIMETLAEEVPLVPLFDQPLTYRLSERFAWEPRADSFVLAREVRLRQR